MYIACLPKARLSYCKVTTVSIREPTLVATPLCPLLSIFGLWVWPSVRCSEVDLYYCWQVGHKNVSVIWNSGVSVIRELPYY